MSNRDESDMEETPPHVGMSRRELKLEFAALHEKADRIEKVLAGSLEKKGLVHQVNELQDKEDAREAARADIKREVRNTAIGSLVAALSAGAAAVFAWVKSGHN